MFQPLQLARFGIFKRTAPSIRDIDTSVNCLFLTANSGEILMPSRQRSGPYAAGFLTFHDVHDFN
jgi:hypothetical protein